MSWRLIRRGGSVFGRDGVRLGRVTRLLGDPDRDIFDGVAFRGGLFAPEHAALIGDIVRITERGVHVRFSEAEAGPSAPPSGDSRAWLRKRRRSRTDDDDEP